MERLLYTSTRLRISGKQGILKPDEEGYYVQPIGAFNCINSLGELYTEKNVKGIYDASSDFSRKIANGKLFGEWGHPDKMPGESESEFMNRACRINDKDTCVFWNKIWIGDAVTPEMRAYGVPNNAIVVMGRFKPMGAKWEALDRSLKDPNVNTTFSGRFLTRDYVERGVVHVIVESVITYDAVTEQGIPVAEKWLSPRLETKSVQLTKQLLDNLKSKTGSKGFRTESDNGLREVISKAETFFNNKSSEKKSYIDWK